MGKPHTSGLARRERQIMDILYRRGRATAAEVQENLPGESNYSTVRTQLRVLEEKGHVVHEDDGVRFTYLPVWKRVVVSSSSHSATVEESISIPLRSSAVRLRSPMTFRTGLRVVRAAGSLVGFVILFAGLARLTWLASRARDVSDERWRS